jgi:hypothetical protein
MGRDGTGREIGIAAAGYLVRRRGAQARLLHASGGGKHGREESGELGGVPVLQKNTPNTLDERGVIPTESETRGRTPRSGGSSPAWGLRGPPACAPAPAEGKAKKCSRKSSSEPPGGCWPAMAGAGGWGTWQRRKLRVARDKSGCWWWSGSVASQEGEAAFGVFFSRERERVRKKARGSGPWAFLCLGPAVN